MQTAEIISATPLREPEVAPDQMGHPLVGLMLNTAEICEDFEARRYLIRCIDWWAALPPEATTTNIVVYPARNSFEEWVLDRWLTHLRSPGFQRSAKYRALRAEWERVDSGQVNG